MGGGAHLGMCGAQLRRQRLPGGQHEVIALSTEPLDGLQHGGLQVRLVPSAHTIN